MSPHSPWFGRIAHDTPISYAKIKKKKSYLKWLKQFNISIILDLKLANGKNIKLQ